MVGQIGSQLKSVSQSETGENNASINLSANNTSEESVSCDYSIDCRSSACLCVCDGCRDSTICTLVRHLRCDVHGSGKKINALLPSSTMCYCLFFSSLESICQLKINKRNETLDEKTVTLRVIDMQNTRRRRTREAEMVEIIKK